MDRRTNPERSNRRKWLIIGGVLTVIVLVVGAVIGYTYWQDEQRSNQAVEAGQRFVENVENQNYEEIAAMLSESSLEEKNYTREEVQERYQTIFGGIGASDLYADNIQIIENEKTDEFSLQYDLHMTTSLGELSPQSYQTALVETEDNFLVEWDTALIFPEMDTGDTVQISMQTGERGNIFDRNGELLAGKAPAWEVGLYPALLGDGEEREENLEAIADTFDTSTEQLENLLSASWVSDETFVPVTLVDEDDRPELPGVLYQETTARAYPLGEAGAHLIGYTGEVFAEDIEEDPTLQPGDIIGKSGLEATFEQRLRGEKGGTINIFDADGDMKTVLQEASVSDGEDITITIDRALQNTYFETFDGESGAAVVTEPDTGELLVLTSSPSYDPLLMARGISAEAYQAYADDEATPFLPRYTARYAPGSTFKAITGAIGLDNGTTTVEKTHTITGYEWQMDESWGEHVITRVQNQPTEVNLEDAYVYSDNIYFAREALEMGADNFMTGLEKFPFEESFDLPIPMNPAQITNSGSFDNERLLADTAYGQGQLLMSPLHQAVFFSPFATGGDLVFPTLESNEEMPERIQPVTAESADTVRDLLVQVVENPNGTAHALSEASGPIAAKTGTTEIQSQDEDRMDVNGFLLAFDAQEQSFLSLILVENAEGVDVVQQFSSLFN